MNILRKLYTFLIDTIQTFVLAAALFLVVYFFLFRPFQVSGDSMVPNFQDKEYVLTNIIELRFGKPKLGDVIVFKAPPDPEKDYIKRVIGVPGDRVLLKDGSVYLNGNLLDESRYLSYSVKTYGGAFLAEGITIIVPSDRLFVLGDNREYSSDSREWGFVPEESVIGESFFIYWPVAQAGVVKNPYN